MYFFICCRHTLRVHFVSDAQFHTDVEEDGGSRITGYFHSPAMLVSATQPLNFDELMRIFNDKVEQFTQRGSGNVLSNTIKLSMIYVTFLPLGGGSSYIPTPKFIAKKRAVVNVKSHGTDYFCWAILAALCPVCRNANQLSSYVCHRDAIDCSELLFLVHPSQIKIFERNNPLIAIHCLALNDKKDSYSILYLSPHMHRCPHKISLLLLHDPAGSDRKHYVWIKMSRASSLSKYAHAHARHVCMSCLQSFTSSRVLHEHERYCLMHEPQQCIYPSRDEAKLAFTRRQYQFLYDFYLVANFECFLGTSDDVPTFLLHIVSIR